MIARTSIVTLVAALVLSSRCLAPCPSARLPTTPVFVQWQSRLRNQLEQPRFQRAQWGILVVSLETGITLFEHHADQFFQPASNAKLFTAAMALDRLGPDYRIRTPVRASSPPDANGVIHGEVCIEGRGDPTWGSEWKNLEIDAALQPLVSIFTNAGVRGIEGDLVGDDRFLEPLRYGTGWTWEDLENGYGSPLSALSFDGNSMALGLAPASAPGAPCEVIFHHPLLRRLTVVNRTVTTCEPPKESLAARRVLGSGQVILSGEILRGARAETLRVPVDKPAEFLMENLATRLRRQGIRIEGGVRVGSSLTATHVLGNAESPPVRTIIRRMLKDSNNLTAALLFAHTGLRIQPIQRDHPERAGSLALNQFLLDAGLPSAEVHIEEGSGLSRNNLVTPRAIVALMTHMHGHPAAKDFIEALPLAGVDGTLDKRFAGTPVQGNLRAKTGTLRWAQALSGYATSQAGEPIAFSILLNRYQPAESDPSGTEAVDALTLLVAELAVRSDSR